MNSHRTKAYINLLLAVSIWGLAGPIIKLTLFVLPADLFLAYRFLISSIIAVVYFVFFGFKIKLKSKDGVLIVAYSLLVSSITLGLLFWGVAKTSLLDMSIIQSLGPLSIVIAGYIFLKDHITKKEIVGMSIAFIGSFVTIIEPVLNNSHAKGQLLGNLLIFASLSTNALAAVILKKLLRSDNKPAQLANFSFLLGFISFLPIVLLQRGLFQNIEILATLPIKYHLGVLYVAIFSGTIAYTLSNMGQKSIEISEAALFSYLNPLFAAILAIVWLNETPTKYFLFGCILIIIGVILAENKKRRFA